MNNTEVKLYWGEGCQPCKATKRWLEKKDIPYTAIEVTAANKDEFGISTVPVIKVIEHSPSGGRLKDEWTGFRPDRLGGMLL